MIWNRRRYAAFRRDNVLIRRHDTNIQKLAFENRKYQSLLNKHETEASWLAPIAPIPNFR